MSLISTEPRPRRILPALICLASLLAGCSTNKDELLPHDGQSMMDIWNQGTAASGPNGTSRQLMDARQALRRPLTELPRDQGSYSRTAENEIHSQFKRLPNPDLVMYVFPHLAGSDPVPVPGYTTIFPLYQRVQYAMPGERVEDY
ncbi:TIGR03751 family conjugal transfer lipoprotein [Azotobacter sp. CWF10]